MKNMITWDMVSTYYLVDFPPPPPGLTQDEILILKCDHVLSKTENIEGRLPELQAAARVIKNSLL